MRAAVGGEPGFDRFYFWGGDINLEPRQRMRANRFVDQIMNAHSARKGPAQRLSQCVRGSADVGIKINVHMVDRDLGFHEAFYLVPAPNLRLLVDESCFTS